MNEIDQLKQFLTVVINQRNNAMNHIAELEVALLIERSKSNERGSISSEALGSND